MIEKINEKVIVVAKVGVVIVTGVAVCAVTTAVIKNVIPFENLTKANKVIFKIGTAIIATMVADKAESYVGGIMDSMILGVKLGKEITKNNITEIDPVAEPV